MKTKILLLLTILFATFSVSQSATEKNDSTQFYFSSAFDELKAMMEGKQTPSFERAVFISENPFHNNQYRYETFQRSIDFHLFFIKNLAAANNYSDTMKYIPKVKANGRFDINEIAISPTKKKELYKNALNNWAIFTYMEDTTGIYPLVHLPFSYSTTDPFGMKDWSNSQLINLLTSEKQEGNCYALTAFFKIMADRLKTGAELCTAPQHIYIQHRDNKGDYYNVELATAGHPGDGMLQTLTYTTSSAIESGISLRSYDDRQSIGLCIVNLAKAYEHTFNTKDDDFLLQCAETVLQNDSLNLNALLLKHQVLNERMLKIINDNKTTNLGKLTYEKTFTELEKHLARLQRLGYKQMPMDVQEMVLNGFEEVRQGKKIDRNPKPFTVEGIPDEYNQYHTLTGGLFQEVFQHQKFEEYGQFTFDTETKIIAAIDTTKKNIALIDPVAFAYDFGARMYDARTGRWMSIDPLAAKYPAITPYAAFTNNPIIFIDPDGRDIVYFNLNGEEVRRQKSSTEFRTFIQKTNAGDVFKEVAMPMIIKERIQSGESTTDIQYQENDYIIAARTGLFNQTKNNGQLRLFTESGTPIPVEETKKIPDLDPTLVKAIAMQESHIGVNGESDIMTANSPSDWSNNKTFKSAYGLTKDTEIGSANSSLYYGIRMLAAKGYKGGISVKYDNKAGTTEYTYTFKGWDAATKNYNGGGVKGYEGYVNKMKDGAEQPTPCDYEE